MKIAYRIIDRLIQKPGLLNLKALDKILTFGIPFNAPHGFKLKKLDEGVVVIDLPNRKLNHNHLGGIHACAIATAGEFCAGMTIMASFGISKYRLIMSELNVKYSYQGRTDLEGTCLTDQIDKETWAMHLANEGRYTQTMISTIREKHSGREVAVVTTTWQVKPWEFVKLKTM